MEPTVYHIRRRLRRRRGNQFYRDRSIRKSESYCGEMTADDIFWNWKAEIFEHKFPCKKCIEIREKETRHDDTVS